MTAFFRAAAAFFLLAAGQAAANPASDPQVTVELVPEFSHAVAGRPNWVALRVVPQPGWHTYWINPGDAGLVTRQQWTLPSGVEAQPTLWPYPHAYREGPLVTYGFGEEHVLLTAIDVPAGYAAARLPVDLTVRWLACKDICIPGRAQLTLDWPLGPDGGAMRRPALFAAARAQMPADARGWGGQFEGHDDGLSVAFDIPADFLAGAQRAEFFAAESSLVDHAATARWHRLDGGLRWQMPISPEFIEWPQRLGGVLVLHDAAGARAYDVELQPGVVPAGQVAFGEPPSPPKGDAAISLGMAALFAFLGGLILNLMPCVFPVLALKALSLAGAEHAADRRIESIYYSVGVLLSFLAVAGLLLALRAAGAALGWGFQLQNPLVVGLLAYLMFIVGLGLADWTQIGMSWMGVGQQAAARGGHRGAFFTGVLAVVVASPCTAPFMGAALGYAVTQNPPTALAVFAALGAGMAFPFLLVSWVPALANRLPRPGPWMDRVKRILAWPMFLTAIWLLWVLYRQAGWLGAGVAVAGLVLIAVALRQSPSGRWVPARWSAALLLLALSGLAFPALQTAPGAARDSGVVKAGDWMAWSDEQVASLRAEGRPVFVNFTAAWCISCLVNERAAFGSASVQELIASRNVALVKADWTNYDPRITQALARFNRNGVPLYLVYPGGGGEPAVLPQLLTPAIVREAIANATP